LRFDRCRDDGIVAEDLFDLVGVGGKAPDADARVTIVGELGAAEMKRVGRLRNDGRKRDGMNVRFPKPQNQPVLGERLLDAKEFEVVAVDGGELLGGVLQGERQDGDLGALNLLGEIGIGAFGSECPSGKGA